ncbi:MAG: 3-keto-disaccharide hydrolase [Verrucomicrobiota bacterium]
MHDGERPQPTVVTPGAFSEPSAPPSDAVVLFDGSGLDQWESHKEPGQPAGWKLLDDGAMEVAPGTGDIQTREGFGTAQYHVEWMAPAEVKGEGQGRGNSGVFLMSAYEIQVLDGYENPTYADGITGAIYGQFPPRVNACRRPGEWQHYDILFTAPKFDGDRLLAPAYLTLLNNGVIVHAHQQLLGATEHKILPKYTAHPERLPLRLQDHGDLVRFRNIWVRPLE